MSIHSIIYQARPGHWIKNVVVLLPVIFGLQMYNINAWLRAFTAAIAFCFVSSSAYVFNDVWDRENDKAHPIKKNRPLASGKINVKTALIELVVLLLAALVIAQSLSLGLLYIVLIYAFMQLFYTTFLKSKVLVDVICIALGFVLRAAAGAVAIKVEISPWLFICMFTICLFMGFCKRYSEITAINYIARDHRPVLIEYTPDLLTHLITLSAGIAVMAFLVYGLNERTVEQFGTNYFIYTLPIVVYAIFRFAMLSMKGSYTGPTDIILHDRVFQITILIWLLVAFCIIRYGETLESWIKSFY